jgi:hypothetical protein
MDTEYRPTEEVREHARQSALAGRPIFVNPHLGSDADVWFDGFREVPDDQCGNWPELLPRSSRKGAKRKRPTPFGDAIKAEVDEAEQRTPRPWGEL